MFFLSNDESEYIEKICEALSKQQALHLPLKFPTAEEVKAAVESGRYPMIVIDSVQPL